MKYRGRTFPAPALPRGVRLSLARLERDVKSLRTHEDRINALRLATQILTDLQEVVRQEWMKLIAAKGA